MSKKRFFILVSHCLLNPSTRVHILGKRFEVAKLVSSYFLEKHISIIQLPCPEFTAMGYLRNPQGRQQYDNIFFRKHCREQLATYLDMVCELKDNNNTPLCFIGIQGSPTCSINWGKHKTNKYKTESMMEDTSIEEDNSIEEDDNIKKEIGVYGIMTEVLDEMLKEKGIDLPFFEAPVKENIKSELVKKFFNDLDNLMCVPIDHRFNIDE